MGKKSEKRKIRMDQIDAYGNFWSADQKKKTFHHRNFWKWKMQPKAITEKKLWNKVQKGKIIMDQVDTRTATSD